MKPKSDAPVTSNSNAKANSSGEKAVVAEIDYFMNEAVVTEARIAAINEQLVAINDGRIPEELLENDDELAALKKENDKLKYRIDILKNSIAEESGRSAVQPKSSNPKSKKSSVKSSAAQTPPAKKSTNAPVATIPPSFLPSDDASSVLCRLSELFSTAMSTALGDHIARHHVVQLVPAGRPQFGDYQCNNAMPIAQAMSKSGTKTSPRSIAEKIVAALPKSDWINKVEVAGPGFINIFLNPDQIVTMVADVLLQGVRPPQVPKKRVVVDFSSPNIAKQMHVGHLRSTIIGECVSRLLEYVGFSVLRLNHVGDWGTQFGMLIAHLADQFPDYAKKAPPIGDLQAFYKESKTRFDSDDEFKARAYKAVVDLQNYEANIVKAWQLICDASRKDFNRIYDRLDVSIVERGESFYQSRMGAVVKELQEKGVLREEDGRKLVFPEGHEVPLTVVKSDGGFTYDTSDLAALKNRLFEENADWIVYVIDQGQSMHMQQIFAVGRQLGWYSILEKRVEHVGFGLVLGEDKKKFKTRSGDTVKLSDLLDEGVKRAKDKLADKEREKSLNASELEAAAEAVAYGCIKYSDLSQNRVQDYVFSFDRMLDDRGNTAVYLLYSYVRIRSICRTARVSRDDVLTYVRAHRHLPFDRPSELKLCKKIVGFVDCIRSVLDTFNLHLLCEYLYDLSTVFTEFYGDCYCIEKHDNGETRVNMHRVALCEATADTMLAGFNILGLRPLSRM